MTTERPRTARIEWRGQPAWLVVFPGGVAFAVQADPQVYVEGLPAFWHFGTDQAGACQKFDDSETGAVVLEWLDPPARPHVYSHGDDPFG